MNKKFRVSNEEASKVINLYENAPVVARKWSNEINQINEALDGNLNYYDAVSTAILLENTSSFIDQKNMFYGGMNEATQANDVGYFKNYALNLLSAVMPNLLAPEIVSIQPMQASVGEIRFLEILYGSDKGRIKKGDAMASPLATGTSDTYYSSNEIVDEFVDAENTAVTATLAWLPVVPGTIEIDVDGVVVTDNGQGALAGEGGITGTVNYDTGELKLTLTTPPAAGNLGINYAYDNITSPVMAPEVNLKISVAPIIAKSRKLKTLYSFDSAFILSNDYGLQINNELMGYTAAQIKHEIDGEIMADLFKMAGAGEVQWDATPRDGISLRDHNESLYNKIVEASNKIFQATRLATGSFLIVGTGVSNIIETLPRFDASGAMNPQGPYFVGMLGSMPVYKNPFYPQDAFVVGWKGNSLFDSGYVYAPYMPIMSTNLIMDAEFQGQRGFATSYGKKMINRNMYAKGSIIRS